MLGRLLLGVGLDRERHLQPLRERGEQRSIELVDLLGDARRAESVSVGPLVAVTALLVGDDGVRGVVESTELDDGRDAEPVSDAGRRGEGERLDQGRSDVRGSVDLRSHHEHDPLGFCVDDVRPEQVFRTRERVGEHGVRRYGIGGHRVFPSVDGQDCAAERQVCFSGRVVDPPPRRGNQERRGGGSHRNVRRPRGLRWRPVPAGE